MIVGTTVIDYVAIKRYIKNPEGIVAYSDSTIPEWARHIREIVLNQRYFYAVHIRNTLTIPFKDRMLLANTLIRESKICGVATNFTQITEVLNLCDKEKLTRALKDFKENRDG